MTHRTDADLIRAAKLGDSSAFGVLISRHQHAAIRVAAIALGSPDGADDVAQDAFVKLFNTIGRFRDGERVEPLLFRIVTNTARTRLRSERRQRSMQLRVEAQGDIADLGPDEIASALTDRKDLIAALNRLRVDDRIVLTYRWYYELSEAEIATAMRCRPGTVKSRLNRAMARLRTELGET